MSYNSTYSPLDTQKLNERVTELENGGDLSDYWTSAQTTTFVEGELADYTPTSGFSTINGSAITSGGNITIQGGGGASPIYVAMDDESLYPNFEVIYNLKKAEVESGATNPDLEHRVVLRSITDDNVWTVPLAGIQAVILGPQEEGESAQLQQLGLSFTYGDTARVYTKYYDLYYEEGEPGVFDFVVNEASKGMDWPEDGGGEEEGGEA